MGSHFNSHISHKDYKSKWLWSLNVFRVHTCRTNRERKDLNFQCRNLYINYHSGRLSVDFPRWSCFVLFFSSVLSYPVMIVTDVHLFSAVAFSFAY